MIIGGAQGVDVTLACCAGINQVSATPAKAFLSEGSEEYIGRQSCMSAIAVRVGMNPDKPMMKARGDFIRLIGTVIDPVAAIFD